MEGRPGGIFLYWTLIGPREAAGIVWFLLNPFLFSCFFRSTSLPRCSAGDLEDSVFSEAKSRLSSLASSIVKHQRSLSRGRDEDSDHSGAFRPRR